MPLEGPRSPLKSSSESANLSNQNNVISPSKKRFIADELPSLRPPPNLSFSKTVTNPSSPIFNRTPEESRDGLIKISSPTKYNSLDPSNIQPLNSPRLVIKKLILTNFKSYVGEQQIGPFDANFNAVVGPNGSGKSNVIDSMLFVFGFRASKMRQAKLSELIHNSENYKNLPFCSVDVHFEEINSTQPENLIVTRKAYRNNSSDYFINGKKSNYTQVTTLLKEKGIDLDHKRFLILQGEVESIAQMKPKAEKDTDDGLLEYLEDIIGTSGYKTEIEDNINNINELNDICIEKKNRFEITENEKNGLENDKDSAISYLKYERQLIMKQNLYFQITLTSRQKKLLQHESELNTLVEKLQNGKNENSSIKKITKELEMKINQFSKNIVVINKEIDSLMKIQRDLDKESVKFNEQKKNLQNKINKLENSISSFESSINKSNSDLLSLKSDQSLNDEKLLKFQNDLKLETDRLNLLRLKLLDKIKPFNDEITEIQKKLQPWLDGIQNKRSAIQLKHSHRSLIEKKFKDIDLQISEMQDKMESVIDQGKTQKITLSNLEQEKQKIKRNLTNGSIEINKAKLKLAEMNNNLNSLRLKLSDAKSNLHNSKNKSKVLTGLLRLQKSGRIQGFHGRLGDLASISAKYDVAISTACSQLDDLVVDSVEVGQQCISYLRSNNLGYARFICLDKLKQNYPPKGQYPMNCSRLFDLINVSQQKFLPAFYSALRETLVSDDLRTANKTAYGSNKRYRVVTLDGKLIDTSGTLSGGGNHVNKGGMKISNTSVANTAAKENNEHMDIITEEDVQYLEQELNRKEQHYSLANETLLQMQTAFKDLEDRKPEVDIEINKAEMEIGSLSGELKNLTKTVMQLTNDKQTNKDAINQELVTVDSEIQKLDHELNELQENSSSLKAKLKSVEQKIMEIGGDDLKLLTSKIDGIKQNIEIYKEKSSKFLHDIKKLQNEAKRNEKNLTKNKKELSDSQIQIERLCKQFMDGQAADLEKAKLESQIDDLVLKKDDIISQVQNSKEELLINSEKIENFKSEELELENQIEILQNKVSSESLSLNKVKNKLETLKIRDVSELISWLDFGIPIKKIKDNENKKSRNRKRKRKSKMVENLEETEASNEETENEDPILKENEGDVNKVASTNEDDYEETIGSQEGDTSYADNRLKTNKDERNTKDKGIKDEGEADNDNESDDNEALNSDEIEELKNLFRSNELPDFTEDQLNQCNKEALLKEIENLETKLENIKVDVEILIEYGKRAKEYHNRKIDLNEAVENRDKLRNFVEELKKKRLNEFMKGFYTISMSLKEMYQMITMGGNAELELVDSLDPFAEGILFSVMPPKKSWKNISNLSGGEKTLSSLALVFALHKYKPTPLYVMDEIDAALDFRNVSIVGNYIKERTKNAQFIVISLRNNMFELSQRLVGIYKVNNKTRSVTLQNKDLINNVKLVNDSPQKVS